MRSNPFSDIQRLEKWQTQAERDQLAEEFHRLRDENKRLRKTLDFVEYVDLGIYFTHPDTEGWLPDHPICPSCFRKKPDGHASYCVLGEALEGRRE